MVALCCIVASGVAPSHAHAQDDDEEEDAPVPTKRPPPTPKPPASIVVRVDNVQVAAKNPARPDGVWDPKQANGASEQDSSRTDCAFLDLVGALGSLLVHPAIGAGAKFLCHKEPRVQRAAPSAGSELPDLALLLSASTTVAYETPTAKDTLFNLFQNEFLLPGGAIPPDGIILRVIDRDGPGHFKTIGAPRLDGNMLIAYAEARARAEASHTSLAPMRVSDPGTALVYAEVVARYYQSPSVGALTMGLAEMPLHNIEVGATASGLLGRKILAGEILEITATGTFDGVGPEGRQPLPDFSCGFYCNPAEQARKALIARSGDGAKFGNAPFKSTRAAVAIATIGQGDARQGIIVGKGCVADIARVDGFLRVGINDNNPSNAATDHLDFIVNVHEPTDDEWKAQKAAGRPGCPPAR